VAEKKRILIVEDNADCRELLRLIFTRQLGCEVVEAATGLAAVEQASATHPDLILMDLGLPGINGAEATERIKANPAIKDIPIVINTAFNATDLTKRALAAGAAEILHKPIELIVLRDTLRKYLSKESSASESVVDRIESNFVDCGR
jgi:two-component system, cell cycle response regulator DivK